MLETIIGFLNWGWLPDNLATWITAITSIVTAATALTSITPTQTDDKVISVVLRILNVLAGNVAKNKNADDV